MATQSLAVQISSDDPRSVRALAVLATSGTWIKAHLKADGHPFFIIPSRKGDTAYWTDCQACTCPDYGYRGVDCAHIRAVKLWAIQKRAEQTPKEHRCQAARERRQQTKQERASEPAPAPAPTAISDYDKYFPVEEDHVHTGSTCFCMAPPLSFGPAVHPLTWEKLVGDHSRGYDREDD